VIAAATSNNPSSFHREAINRLAVIARGSLAEPGDLERTEDGEGEVAYGGGSSGPTLGEESRRAAGSEGGGEEVLCTPGEDGSCVFLLSWGISMVDRQRGFVAWKVKAKSMLYRRVACGRVEPSGI
jgi:hypothetical protein